jgi:hypothetical protein
LAKRVFSKSRSTLLRKQGANLLGSRAQIQNSWVFSSSSMKFPTDRVLLCKILEIWDFGQIRATPAADHDNIALNFLAQRSFKQVLICLIWGKGTQVILEKAYFSWWGPWPRPGFWTSGPRIQNPWRYAVRYIALSLYSKFQPSRCRNDKKKV